MGRSVFLAAASLVSVPGVSAQQHNIDTQKSTLAIHVGKEGALSGLRHEHGVRAPIHSGTAEVGSHSAVKIHVDARSLYRRGQCEANGIRDQAAGKSGRQSKNEFRIEFEVRLVP